MQYFVVMIDYGRRGREAIVDPEITRREVISRVASGEYRNISFIHEIADCSVEDITAEILSEAARPEREERPPKEPAPAKDAGRPKEPRRPREQRRPAAVQSRGSSKSGTRAAEAKRRKAGASDSRRSADAGRPERAEQREQKRETGPRSGNGKAGEERPRPATAS